MKIYLDEYESCVGRLTLASNGEQLCALWLEGQKYFAEKLELRCGAEGAEGAEGVEYVTGAAAREESVGIAKARAWLETYFAAKDAGPLPPMAFCGTPVQEDVWNRIARIPYGTTITYGDIAQELAAKRGKNVSARAVGVAVGRNPISIIVPCHRVVGAGGKLTGYAGGIERKRTLLELEDVDVAAMR